MNEHLAEFAAMAAIIAPELDAYIFNQPPDWPATVGGAYCVDPCTPDMRDWLKARGEWAGNKPAIVFVDPADDSAESRGILIHELAHALPATAPLSDREPSVLERLWHAAEFEKFAKEPVAPGLPPWDGHDAAFIRRALHLHRRAVAAGWEVGLRHLIIAGPTYGVGCVLNYWSALGTEPERMVGKSFAEIEAEPMPEAFAALWAADVQAWKKRQRPAAANAA